MKSVSVAQKRLFNQVVIFFWFTEWALILYFVLKNVRGALIGAGALKGTNTVFFSKILLHVHLLFRCKITN